MAIASITRLRLRSNRYMLPFLWHALLSTLQVKRADGCVAADTGRHGQAFWTVSLWRDAAALKAFMLSGAHRKAMPNLVNWCDESSTARIDWTDSTPPTFADAKSLMAAQGRITPLKHPSPAHAAGNVLGEEGQAATV